MDDLGIQQLTACCRRVSELLLRRRAAFGGSAPTASRRVLIRLRSVVVVDMHAHVAVCSAVNVDKHWR